MGTSRGYSSGYNTGKVRPTVSRTRAPISRAPKTSSYKRPATSQPAARQPAARQPAARQSVQYSDPARQAQSNAVMRQQNASINSGADQAARQKSADTQAARRKAAAAAQQKRQTRQREGVSRNAKFGSQQAIQKAAEQPRKPAEDTIEMAKSFNNRTFGDGMFNRSTGMLNQAAAGVGLGGVPQLDRSTASADQALTRGRDYTPSATPKADWDAKQRALGLDPAQVSADVHRKMIAGREGRAADMGMSMEEYRAFRNQQIGNHGTVKGGTMESAAGSSPMSHDMGMAGMDDCGMPGGDCGMGGSSADATAGATADALPTDPNLTDNTSTGAMAGGDFQTFGGTNLDYPGNLGADKLQIGKFGWGIPRDDYFFNKKLDNLGLGIGVGLGAQSA